MANFQLNVPIETIDNHVQVTPSPGDPLRPGRHVFQLVVVDQSGNRSAPATVEIIIRDTTAPTAVLRLVIPDGEDPNTWQPSENMAFELSAADSSDIGGGPIVRYIWTLTAVPPVPTPEPPEPTPTPDPEPTPGPTPVPAPEPEPGPGPGPAPEPPVE
jgi:hypothetical protein